MSVSQYNIYKDHLLCAESHVSLRLDHFIDSRYYAENNIL